MVRARRGLSPSIVRRGLSSNVRLNCSVEGSIILGDWAITVLELHAVPMSNVVGPLNRLWALGCKNK